LTSIKKGGNGREDGVRSIRIGSGRNENLPYQNIRITVTLIRGTLRERFPEGWGKGREQTKGGRELFGVKRKPIDQWLDEIRQRRQRNGGNGIRERGTKVNRLTKLGEKAIKKNPPPQSQVGTGGKKGDRQGHQNPRRQKKKKNPLPAGRNRNGTKKGAHQAEGTRQKTEGK